MTRRLLAACLVLGSMFAFGCDDTGGDTDSGIICADCGIDGGGPRDAGADAGRNDAGGMDAGDGADAGSDAGVSDAAVPSSDAAKGAACAFNRECAASQRCECDVSSGCMCMTGARGTGRNGIDTCSDGNDCASSLCVEGSDGRFYCSDECVTDTDCTGGLPRCLDIAFVGRICARIPPDAGT